MGKTGLGWIGIGIKIRIEIKIRIKIRIEIRREGYPRGIEVGFMMVDAEKWLAEAEGKALGGFQSDEQRSGQAGSLGGGHGIQLRRGQASVAQGLAGDGEEIAQMFAGGQFGDDPAVGRMQTGLAGNDVGENGAAGNNRRAGFIARSLECEQIQSSGAARGAG